MIGMIRSRVCQMAVQQPEPRVTVDLPVRVWGMTAEGRPFSQHARAQNISSEGALLSGVENELKVGDVIGVQCDDKKTRCTVIWVMNTGLIKKNQVGVKLLLDQECPWKTYLPIQGATVSVLPSNRRRWPRHKISFPLELRDERINTPMRISAPMVNSRASIATGRCNSRSVAEVTGPIEANSISLIKSVRAVPSSSAK